MRDLKRNQTVIYYRMYKDNTEILDEYGNFTGQFKPRYGKLKAIAVSVSANKGNADSQQFGSLLDYDRVLLTANLDCEIDENTVLWIDGADTEKPHNYIVKRVARSLNQVQIAVKRVTVSEANQNKT